MSKALDRQRALAAALREDAARSRKDAAIQRLNAVLLDSASPEAPAVRAALAEVKEAHEEQRDRELALELLVDPEQVRRVVSAAQALNAAKPRDRPSPQRDAVEKLWSTIEGDPRRKVKDIADKLGITPGSVRDHRRESKRKRGAGTKTQG